MELRLSDNSRVHFTWTQGGSLYVELYQPGNLRDGHGILLSGGVMLDGKDLREFFSFLSQQQPRAEAA